MDLTRYTEATRREVYDRVVRHLWTPIDPGDYVPSYTPDAAQLMVSYLGGRWIVAYIDLEEPTLKKSKAPGLQPQGLQRTRTRKVRELSQRKCTPRPTASTTLRSSTPAMSAGVESRKWEIADLISLLPDAEVKPRSK